MARKRSVELSGNLVCKGLRAFGEVRAQHVRCVDQTVLPMEILGRCRYGISGPFDRVDFGAINPDLPQFGLGSIGGHEYVSLYARPSCVGRHRRSGVPRRVFDQLGYPAFHGDREHHCGSPILERPRGIQELQLPVQMPHAQTLAEDL